MNTSESKPNVGLYKVISAILIGIVLILVVGIAVNGWQEDQPNGDNSGDGGENNSTADADQPGGDTDEETSGTADNISDPTEGEEDEKKENEEPKFYNYLTGLECTEDVYRNIPYASVFEPNAPLYGISDAELVIEIPTENGNTRYMLFNSDISGLGKIGAFCKTRNYISQIVKFFGGIHVAYGKDDIVSYDAIPSTLHLNLAEKSDYVYKENGKNIYSDADKIETLAENEGIDTKTLANQALPFEFCEINGKVKGKTLANKILIPYKTDLETALTYDEASGTYMLSKGGRNKIDMLDGSVAAFKNVFILFADMITYELSEGTQTVVQTATSGTGYYITCGTLIEIRWSVNDSGLLEFRDLNGDILTVNRGNSYISYYKSATADDVIFE